MENINNNNKEEKISVEEGEKKSSGVTDSDSEEVISVGLVSPPLAQEPQEPAPDPFATLASQISSIDRKENMRVIREAKHAVLWYWDKKLERHVQKVDHKMRMAAVALQLAYDEGTPVQRQALAITPFRSAQELIDAMSSSPEAQRTMSKRPSSEVVPFAVPRLEQKDQPLKEGSREFFVALSEARGEAARREAAKGETSKIEPAKIEPKKKEADEEKEKEADEEKKKQWEELKEKEAERMAQAEKENKERREKIEAAKKLEMEEFQRRAQEEQVEEQ
jgi:colicin import membrane protein